MKNSEDYTLNLWPWERGEKPYFTNEEGFEWYIEKDLTKQCQTERLKLPAINMVVFLVAKNNEPLERVLMDVKTEQIVYSSTSLEEMAVHIDWLKLVKQKNDG